MSNNDDEYWQDRLTEQEVTYERRIEKLEALLEKAAEALEFFEHAPAYGSQAAAVLEELRKAKVV